LAATYTLISTAGRSASFSPSGDYIAIAYGSDSGPNFTLLDHTTPGSVSLAATYTLPENGYWATFSYDGNYIATTSDTIFTLLDHTTPGSVSLSTTYTLAGNGWQMSFSPDDKYIAVGSSLSPRFTLLNYSSGSVSLATTYVLPGDGLSVVFSPV
jgi:WD40 repeat protein